MTKRLDLYGECNLEKAPVEVFTTECCARCINPDCTRSQWGKSHFEDRVTNWYDRLFAQVPRMTPGDPRYQQISAQKFLLLQPSLTVSSGWVDPRAVEAAQQALVMAPTPEPTVTQVPEPAAESAITPAPAPELQKSTGALPINLVIANTPAKGGQMLTPKQPAASVSGWSSLQPPPPGSPQGPQVPGAKVVKAGAKIKLGE